MKPIAFDIGNVLVKVNLWSLGIALVEHGYLDAASNFFPFWNYVSPMIDIGVTDVKNELVNNFDVNTNDLNTIMNAWAITVQPVKEITDLISELQKKYNIALLSNIGLDRVEYLRLQFPPVYNKCIQHFSCEVGARKPSKLFFQSFLIDYPEFRGCVFIDDKEENVAMAKAMGFNAIQFVLDDKDNKLAATELRKIVLDKVSGI